MAFSIWSRVVGDRVRLEELSSLTSPDHFGPIATEVVVWPPGLVAAEVVGQDSIVIYDLAIVHLYVQYLIRYPKFPVLSFY